jgi:hypothetical protein
MTAPDRPHAEGHGAPEAASVSSPYLARLVARVQAGPVLRTRPPVRPDPGLQGPVDSGSESESPPASTTTTDVETRGVQRPQAQTPTSLDMAAGRQDRSLLPAEPRPATTAATSATHAAPDALTPTAEVAGTTGIATPSARVASRQATAAEAKAATVRDAVAPEAATPHGHAHPRVASLSEAPLLTAAAPSAAGGRATSAGTRRAHQAGQAVANAVSPPASVAAHAVTVSAEPHPVQGAPALSPRRQTSQLVQAPEGTANEVHIGRIQLNVRQPPAPPRPASRDDAQRHGRVRDEAPAFSSHRHYLRGL